MTLETLAMAVVEAVESAGVEFMVVGAMAAGAYGVPRSTRDLDLLVSVNVEGGLASVMARLDSTKARTHSTWLTSRNGAPSMAPGRGSRLP